MRILVLFYLALLISCNSNERTLEELASAQWNTLEPGIEYIEITGGQIKPTDSVYFLFKGASISGVLISPEMLDADRKEQSSAMTDILLKDIKSKLQGKQGYLRVDLGKYYSLKNPEVTIFLRGTLDPATNADYQNRLRSFPGVEKVEYISKEAAAEQFNKDNPGSNWETILDENPLPESYQLTISPDYLEEEKMKSLKDSIELNFIYVSDVQYPRFLDKKGQMLYFIRYNAR